MDRSWEYINRSQTHECRNWGSEAAQFLEKKYIYKRNCLSSVGRLAQKDEPNELMLGKDNSNYWPVVIECSRHAGRPVSDEDPVYNWADKNLRVRRSSVGSASDCCKAGPSLILGSAPHGSPSLAERSSDKDTSRRASANGEG